MSVIKFYKVNEPYGFFSNFSPHPIFIENELWRTVEHYFQASKFEDMAVRMKIKGIESPMRAAIEGRDKNNSLRKNWETIKNKIMQEALLCKFLQHPKLRKELLLTKNSLIVEHTINDYYWGDGGDGGGKNMLGILLMKVRDEIEKKYNNPNLIIPPWIPFPSISQYDLFWRMGLGEEYLTQWAKFYLETDKELYRQEFPETREWEGIYD